MTKFNSRLHSVNCSKCFSDRQRFDNPGVCRQIIEGLEVTLIEEA